MSSYASRFGVDVDDGIGRVVSIVVDLPGSTDGVSEVGGGSKGF